MTVVARLGRLGGVVLGVPAPTATATFLRDGLGFTVAQDGDRLVASCVGDYGGDGQAAIELRPARELAVLEVRWEVPQDYDMAALEARLDAAGLRARRVERGLRFDDPSGIPCVCLRTAEHPGGAPPHDPLRPRRLGHVNLTSQAPPTAAAFYRDVLGMRLSEQIGNGLYFLRIGSEHHNVGLRGGETGDLHHLGFEVEGWNVYQPILDRLAERGLTVEYGPGRHRPGNNLFVYVCDPSSGLRLELFADMAQIPDASAHTPRRWEADDRMSKTINRWGPAPPPSFLA